jgi:hypothetical protein
MAPNRPRNNRDIRRWACIRAWRHALDLVLAATFAWTLGACGGGKAPQPAPTPAVPAGPGRTFHVSPSGSSGGDGSTARPYDLATILANGGPARGGDTIWLHGGTYRGAWGSYLTGTTDAPIILRQYPGDRAILDGNDPAAENQGAVLAIYGANTTYWGFEITSSRGDRVDQKQPSSPAGITMLGSSNIKLINLIVHDLPGNGMGLWSENTGAEIYGSIVYYNGLNQFDHGMYIQNRTGLKQITDNVIFRGAGHGIHAYGSGAAFLDDIQLDGNTLFNNGELTGGTQRNILVGGDTVAHRPRVTSNSTYYPSTQGANNLGYAAGCTDAVVTDNAFAGGDALELINCTPTQMARNQLRGFWLPQNMPDLFPDNSYTPGIPTGTQVVVRPNRYESGRALVTIFNWDMQSRVSVDISKIGLTNGDHYNLIDPQNLGAGAIETGTYSGSSITVPMTGLTTARPVWQLGVPAPHTPPEFGVFLIQKQ